MPKENTSGVAVFNQVQDKEFHFSRMQQGHYVAPRSILNTTVRELFSSFWHVAIYIPKGY